MTPRQAITKTAREFGFNDFPDEVFKEIIGLDYEIVPFPEWTTRAHQKGFLLGISYGEYNHPMLGSYYFFKELFLEYRWHIQPGARPWF